MPPITPEHLPAHPAPERSAVTSPPVAVERPLSAFEQARAEALPYARAIVASRQHPARFNQADIWHAVGLEVGAIASTAIAQRRPVVEVVRRHYPDMVAQLAATIEALAMLATPSQTQSRRAA